MKNRSAAISARPIPYFKTYREFCGSVLSSILFVQLEYWFGAQHGRPFYKFLEPAPAYKKYKAGDSWTEELGFSLDEFRTAFKKIGIVYKSRKQYNQAGSQKFIREDGSEAFYCSVIDRVRGETTYFRNDRLVDRILLQAGNGRFSQSLSVDGDSQSTEGVLFGLSVDGDSRSTADGDSPSGSLGIPISVDGESPSHVPVPIHVSETTTETTFSCPGVESGAAATKKDSHARGRRRAKRTKSKIWIRMAEHCGIDLRVHSTEQAAWLSRAEADLRAKLPGHSEAQLLIVVDTIADYFRKNDWRGKVRGQNPQPKDFIELYGAAAGAVHQEAV